MKKFTAKNVIIALCLATTASALVGCAPHVYSPPARVSALESAKPVAKDETSGGVAVGMQGEVFGFETLDASARVRRGVTEHSELGLDANMMRVNDSEAAADVDPYIWSARAGGKWAPALLEDHIALIYGIGAGTSEGGPFVSPDVGAVLAWENPYLVPFASVNGFVSEPLDARPVDVSTHEEGVGTNVQTASTTWGATVTGGLKWPISVGGSTVAPMVGMSHSLLSDGAEESQVTGLSVGTDVTF